MSLFPRDLQRHVNMFYGKHSGIVVGNTDERHRGEDDVVAPRLSDDMNAER